METFEILVSILSVVLTILLILIIVAVIYAVRLIRQIHHIAEQAVTVMDDVKTASKVFKNAAAPAAASRIIANVVEMWQERKQK
jgi:predicted PurR-regulated permease PerM